LDALLNVVIVRHTLFHLSILSHAGPSPMFDDVSIILRWWFMQRFHTGAQSRGSLVYLGRVQHFYVSEDLLTRLGV
jgi:hypothetical protein